MEPAEERGVLPDGHAIERLFERPDLPAFDLPAPLVAAYGGALGFARPRLVANFVASVDGVVALPIDAESGKVVSGGSSADRFVMGCLRACADVVLIGAGTFRKAAKDHFDAAAIYPAGATCFAEVRRSLGLGSKPRLAILTATGDIDPTAPALAEQAALVFTTPVGEARLRGRTPSEAQIITVDAPVDLAQVIERVRADAGPLVLTEGGPSLFAGLLRARWVDELFVTTSPKLFGRFPGDGRKSLAFGLDVRETNLELLSLRRHGDHLFARYAVERDAAG